MKRVLFIILLITLSYASAQTLLLFSGSDHKTFLGCINSNKYDSGSIWNKYGEYGSKYSSSSIWNSYGMYGSRYSSESPWNKYASDPPIIVDENGNYYGCFTINKYANQTRIEWILSILDNYEYVLENPEKAYEQLF